MADFEHERNELCDRWLRADVVSENVVDAFRQIPREEFVLLEYKDEAYEDRPLPILKGQTISQPTTVAMMTDALEVDKGQNILEIGSGSGYQAAILSKLVGDEGHVYSIEIIPELVEFAKNNLSKIGIKNVTVLLSDGSEGLREHAPYDRIIVTAAAPNVPDPLIAQLTENGILIMPVGSVYDQEMVKLTKTESGLKKESLGNFVFVKLKGKYGWG